MLGKRNKKNYRNGPNSLDRPNKETVMKQNIHKDAAYNATERHHTRPDAPAERTLNYSNGPKGVRTIEMKQ